MNAYSQTAHGSDVNDAVMAVEAGRDANIEILPWPSLSTSKVNRAAS